MKVGDCSEQSRLGASLMTICRRFIRPQGTLPERRVVTHSGGVVAHKPHGGAEPNGGAVAEWWRSR